MALFQTNRFQTKITSMGSTLDYFVPPLYGGFTYYSTGTAITPRSFSASLWRGPLA